MTFILKLNIRERRHERLRQRILQSNDNLQASYLVKYTTKGGGVGQTYVWAKTEEKAKREAKAQAEIYGGKLLSINKTTTTFYDNKSKSLKEFG